MDEVVSRWDLERDSMRPSKSVVDTPSVRLMSLNMPARFTSLKESVPSARTLMSSP